MSTEAIMNLIFSIVTAAIAVAAVLISVVQIRKSNKQALFDRRLKAYLIVKWMQSLCNEHQSLAKTYIKDAETNLLLGIDFLFILMTNCTFLEEIGPAITKTVDDKELHRKYLFKIEELKNLCEEVRLIFPENIGYELADFIFYYEEMLVSIFKYKVAIDNIKVECRANMEPPRTNDQLENKQRKEVTKYISGTFDLAERLLKNNVFELAKQSIKL